MQAYRRDEIIRKFVQQERRIYSIPTTQFIDAFALFGKGTASFFSMLGIYLTPGNIRMVDREMLINQYPLVLGPMGIDLKTAAETIAPGCLSLAWGTDVTINGEQSILVSFDMAKIGIFDQIFIILREC